MGESHWEPSSRLQQYIWSLELNCKVLLSCSTVAGQNRLTQSYWRLAPFKGTSQVWEKLLLFRKIEGVQVKPQDLHFNFIRVVVPHWCRCARHFVFMKQDCVLKILARVWFCLYYVLVPFVCSWNMSVRRQQLSTGKRLIRFELFSIGVSFSGYQIACNFRRHLHLPSHDRCPQTRSRSLRANPKVPASDSVVE